MFEMSTRILKSILLVTFCIVFVESKSCAEVEFCCTGHNMTCQSPRHEASGTAKCFCDEVCLELGDCCADFVDTCLNDGKSSKSIRKRRSAGMRCKPVDLILVMDESGSIGHENYNKMLQFARNLLRNFRIGPNDMRVAVVKFGFDAKFVFNFNSYNTYTELNNAISKISYGGGGTNTAAGLHLAGETSFLRRPDAETVAIVFTDGGSNDPDATTREAAFLQGTGTKVFSVGIGQSVNLTELRSIASDPDSKFLVTSLDFNDLFNKLQHVIDVLCRDVDECQSSPCFSGTCINIIGSYRCNCNNGWGSFHCDKDLCNTEDTKLVFVVDSSFSSTDEIFFKQVQYIKDSVSKLTISDHKFQVAVISYGSTANVTIDFNSYKNKTELLDQLSGIPFINGTTNIAAACKEVKKILPLTPMGSQYMYVFLFTDGMPTSLNDAVAQIRDLRTYLTISNNQNEVFLIAFGNQVRHEGLLRLSGYDRHSDVFPSTNIEPLHLVFQKRVNIACPACKVQRDVDVAFILDTSAMQPPSTYLASRNMFLQLLTSMHEFVFLGPQYMQIGAVQFSHSAKVFLSLNFTHDLNLFASTFQELKQDDYNSTSNLSNALRFVQQEMFTSKHGARDGTSKYAILVFNGYGINITESISIAEDMTEQGITLISIGVGTRYRDEDVLKIASSPFHAYFAEHDFSSNQWILSNTEFEFIKKFRSRLECTNRINA